MTRRTAALPMAEQRQRERCQRQMARETGPVPTGPESAHLLLRANDGLVPTRPPSHLLLEWRARFPNPAAPHAPHPPKRMRKHSLSPSPASPLPFHRAPRRGGAGARTCVARCSRTRTSGRRRGRAVQRFAAAWRPSRELRAASSRGAWRVLAGATRTSGRARLAALQRACEAARAEKKHSESLRVRARGGV